MKLEIAGLSIDLRLDGPARGRWDPSRFARFRTRRRADLRLHVQTDEELGPGSDRIYGHADPDGVWAWGRHAIAVAARRDRFGVAWLSSRRFPLNALMRVLVALSLLEEGGLLLHASGVRAGRGAWVFPGRSGAGKSTLARRFPIGEVLSDEVIAVRVHRGRPEATGTPFPGELNVQGRPGWLPLLGFAFLRGARRPRAVPLGPADALRRLLSCTLGSWATEEDVPRVWSAATGLVRTVPCAELGFSAAEPRSSILSRLDAWRQPPNRGRARSPR